MFVNASAKVNKSNALDLIWIDIDNKMPLYEGIGLASDKHSVVIEIGQAYTK